MKQHLLVVVAVLCVMVLIIASIASISRAKIHNTQFFFIFFILI